MPAPRRPLNPLLRRRLDQSGKTKQSVAFIAGFPNYPGFYETLRAERVPATKLTVQRLQSVADAIGFPRDEIFLERCERVDITLRDAPNLEAIGYRGRHCA